MLDHRRCGRAVPQPGLRQPARERGDGWTDEQLKQFGADAGLTGEAQSAFDKCVDEGTYKGWAQLSNDAAFERGISSTPTIYVSGRELKNDAFASEQAFKGTRSPTRNSDPGVHTLAFARGLGDRSDPDQGVRHVHPAGIFVAVYITDKRWKARGGGEARSQTSRCGRCPPASSARGCTT